MISDRLQIVAIIVTIVFFFCLIRMLKKNDFALKYSLLWLLSGAIMLVLAIFPGILDWFASLIGVYSSVNALFAVLICCGIMLMISFTSIISKEKKEIVRLVQEMAVLDNRLRELEKTAEVNPEGWHQTEKNQNEENQIEKN